MAVVCQLYVSCMLSVVCCMSTMWILRRPSIASSTPPNHIPPFPCLALRPATQATTENVYGAYSGHIEFQQIVLVIKSFYLTNRFHFAVRMFSNRSQMTSKCGKNKKVAHEAQPSVSLMLLPHFDVFCNLLLNQTHGNMESIC